MAARLAPAPTGFKPRLTPGDAVAAIRPRRYDAATAAARARRDARGRPVARKFLYVMAALIVLVLAAAIGWNLFQDRIMRAAFVPGAPFAAPAGAGAPDYARPAAWLARPGLAGDPTRYLPAGVTPGTGGRIAVFYVSPTAFTRRSAWNAPLDDAETNQRLDLFARAQASAFNGVGAVWAPRYRQAGLGAFLSSGRDAAAALNFAYRDVARAFAAFLRAIPADQPIMLVGHSQGSLHLMRLIHDRVAGRPLARRIVAAYLVGWPISVTADLPALGLPGCARAGQANCIVSWQSFAEPADPHQIRQPFEATIGLTGHPRRGTRMLCVNPLTGTAGGSAPAGANIGALVPRPGMDGADLVAGHIPARCDAQGFLLIGPPPAGYAGFVLPGENYHVFDYPLFWANTRADAAARAATFLR